MALALAFARADPALIAALTLIVIVLVLVGYPVAWETLSGGRTPGKMALGLRVIRADGGGPIEFRHALTRGLCGVIVDFWMLGVFGFVAVVSSTASERGRRVGDLLAGVRDHAHCSAAVRAPERGARRRPSRAPATRIGRGMRPSHRPDALEFQIFVGQCGG